MQIDAKQHRDIRPSSDHVNSHYAPQSQQSCVKNVPCGLSGRMVSCCSDCTYVVGYTKLIVERPLQKKITLPQQALKGYLQYPVIVAAAQSPMAKRAENVADCTRHIYYFIEWDGEALKSMLRQFAWMIEQEQRILAKSIDELKLGQGAILRRKVCLQESC